VKSGGVGGGPAVHSRRVPAAGTSVRLVGKSRLSRIALALVAALALPLMSYASGGSVQAGLVGSSMAPVLSVARSCSGQWIPVTPDPSISLLVTACRNKDSSQISVTNVSAGVLALTRSNDDFVTWRELPARDDLTDWAVRQSVQAGQFGRQFNLVPRATVIGTVLAPPLRVSVAVLGAESAKAYAASSIAGWVQDKMRNPVRSKLGAIRDCVMGAAKALNGDYADWEDALRGAVHDIPNCNTVMKIVTGSSEERAIATSADDIVRRASRFTVVWDDLMKLLGRAATLFPR